MYTAIELQFCAERAGRITPRHNYNSTRLCTVEGFVKFVTDVCTCNYLCLQASYNTCQWEPKRLPWAMPSLNYAAPEAMLSRTCDVSSDMFSFGVLIYAVYNGGKPPYDCMDDITAFKRNVEQVIMSHRKCCFQIVKISCDNLMLKFKLCFITRYFL